MECRDDVVRIAGLDPGSYHLGASMYDHNARFDTTRLIAVGDMDVADHERYPHYNVFGNRGKRLELMADYVYQFLCFWRPDIVVCEDAYLSRFAAPYRSLVEGIAAIRRAVYRYNPDLELILVEPSKAKVAFGAAHKGAGKDGARKGVYEMVGPLTDIDLTALNEHTIDAVGIGYWGVEEWRRQMQLPVVSKTHPEWWQADPVVKRQPPPVPKSPTPKRTSRGRKRGTR